MDWRARWECRNSRPAPALINSYDPGFTDGYDALIAGLWGAGRDDYCAEQFRSRALLASLLTDEDLSWYETHQWVAVTGSHGGQYRLKYGSTGNVVRVSDRLVLCAHLPRLGGPHETDMVAQLLMLRYNEPGFLRAAYRLGCELG